MSRPTGFCLSVPPLTFRAAAASELVLRRPGFTAWQTPCRRQLRWLGSLPIVICCCVLLWLMSDNSEAAMPAGPNSPTTPVEALQSFELAEDLRIELVAAEPLVIDPVAIAFDADERLYVVEMHDYPYGPPAGEPGMSRIRRLEDRDQDGQYDAATIFAENLLFPTGLLPYGRGFIVTLAGELAYLEDTDGDGRCDLQERWFEGFVQENSQLRANHPTPGPDQRIYVANGLRGGTVRRVAAKLPPSEVTVPLTGRDFRFDPRTGAFAAVSGNGQFGLCFDNFGNRFVCSNRNPCQHVVLEQDVLGRNPQAAIAEVMQDVCAPAESSRLFPIVRTFTTSDQHTGTFTAACGVLIYRGQMLPREFLGNAFTCDPTAHVVHRERVVPAGMSYRGERTEDGREFLASRDNWFSPVNLANGPDGALYVVDMYRAVIEHPDWMPPELKQRPDTRLGDDRGRIYRIRPADSEAAADGLPQKTPARMTAAELVGLLSHPNSWQRETAQRLLCERPDPAAVPLLRKLVTTDSPVMARWHALWTLEALGQLQPEELVAVSHARDPELVRLAVELAGRHGWLPEVARSEVRRVWSAGDQRVRAQLLMSAGWPDSVWPVRTTGDEFRWLEALDLTDRWLRRVLVTVPAEQTVAVLVAALHDGRGESDAGAGGSLGGLPELIEEAAQVIASGRELPMVDQLLQELLVARTRWLPSHRPVLEAALLRGLGAGLARTGQSLASVLPVNDHPTAVRPAAVREVFGELLEAASNRDQPLATRTQLIQALRFAAPDWVKSELVGLAESSPTSEIRVASLGCLSQWADAEVARDLVVRFPGETPALRRAILDYLMRQPAATAVLLEALEGGQLKPSELDPARVQQLATHGVAEIRDRALRIYHAANADRAAILEEYRPSVTQAGDLARGKMVFEKVCASCHRVAGVGTNVGPDVGDNYARTREALLLAILDPNRAVDNNYFGYAATLADGRTMTGIIVAETATAVTLRLPDGKNESLLRDELDELRSTGVSLMPVGLEKSITVEQMADLLTFLKNWRYAENGVPVTGP